MTATHTDNIIELHQVGFAYERTAVLKDINLVIHRGDYLGVVGPNGGGKTTLLKIILGLLKPSTGIVHVHTARTSLGYVSQTLNLIDRHFPATVQEVVAMGCIAQRGLWHHLTAVDRSNVTEALTQVGMLNFSNRLIGDLSGGQQQRVFIARALVTQPTILILDEPTDGVDAQHQEQFYSLLRHLNTHLQLTLVLVSHDLDRVSKEATELACINQTLVYHGSPADFHPHQHL